MPRNPGVSEEPSSRTDVPGSWNGNADFPVQSPQNPDFPVAFRPRMPGELEDEMTIHGDHEIVRPPHGHHARVLKGGKPPRDGSANPSYWPQTGRVRRLHAEPFPQKAFPSGSRPDQFWKPRYLIIRHARIISRLRIASSGFSTSHLIVPLFSPPGRHRQRSGERIGQILGEPCAKRRCCLGNHGSFAWESYGLSVRAAAESCPRHARIISGTTWMS